MADGVLNPGEQILPGVIVILTNATGQEVTRTTTDANGCYLFDPLPPGNYTIIFELPNGFIGFTLSNQTPNGSDADPVSGQTVLINLEAGERDLTWDAGFVQTPATGEQPGEEPTKTSVIFLPLVGRQ